MANQRPAGVTILVVLKLIGSILSLVLGAGILAFGSQLTQAELEVDPTGSLPAGPTSIVWGVIMIVAGIAGLIVAYGLFNLKLWAWWGAVIIAAINAGQHLTRIINGSYIPAGIVGLVVVGLVVYYLNRSNVKKAFGKQ